MNILQICLSHLSHVATLPWEIKKRHFSISLFIYFRLFTIPMKKTNSNCCTAALAVYLLLFSASCYLHSHSTASGACEAGGKGLLRHRLYFSTTWCTVDATGSFQNFQHLKELNKPPVR